MRCRRSGGWSLPEDQVAPDAPPGQLYDLAADVGEGANRYRDLPAVVERLEGILAAERSRGV